MQAWCMLSFDDDDDSTLNELNIEKKYLWVLLACIYDHKKSAFDEILCPLKKQTNVICSELVSL